MRLAVAAALLAFAPPAASADDPAARLKAHVEYLASDDLAGRDVGTDGIAMAEEHVASVFADLGLHPLPGHDSYFLPFELHREGFDPSCTWARLDTSGHGLSLGAGIDFRPFDFSGEGSVSADIVFAGYGITSPEQFWDDYDGLDVSGKVVLVLRHVPREGDPDGPFAGAAEAAHATFAAKAGNARDHGATAILVVTDPLHHSEIEDLRWGGRLRLPPLPSAAAPARADRPTGESGVEGADADQPPILALQISRRIAELLVRATRSDLAELQLAVDSGSPPAAVGGSLGRMSLAVGRRSQPEIVECRDVVAMLPGSDLRLCEEWVVASAHHDHLGAFDGPGDTVYNGADDNASGTAAVLELARLFAGAPTPPRRTLVFATFSAEEKGLLGSRWLVERSGLPLERIAFMLNSDMLGRNPEQPIEAIGDGFTNGLREAVEDASVGLGIDIEFGGDGYFGASDHDPFYKRDIPFLFFFTGLHADYHQLSDHADRIDFGREARIVELSRRLLARLADVEERPQFVHHVPWLGLEAESAGVGASRVLVVTGLHADGRATAAGLLPGDVITAFDGAPFEDATRIGERFRSVDPGSTAALTVARGPSRVDLVVSRAKPGFLGIVPSALEADERRRLGLHDDEGLVVRQVTNDGPASIAGVEAGDVLVRLAGQPVVQRTLSGVLSQVGAGETVDAMLLRGGNRVTLRLTVGERPPPPPR